MYLYIENRRWSVVNKSGSLVRFFLISACPFSVTSLKFGMTLNIHSLTHTYQSLSCETAINTEFSELFSLKRIYVKYKNAILSHKGCSFRT